MSVIKVEGLSKTFRTKAPAAGWRSSVTSLFAPSYIDVKAVRAISFSIEAGERVAFIGPNGAGKSTMIKILTGILHPSAGTARVADLVPWERRRDLSYQIGCVFGQRSQLWFHLSVRDSFEILRRIYGVSEDTFGKRVAEFTDVFQLGDLLDKRVSRMSLGERMRCEIVASLLHGPRILFLDEPSIGLDVVARIALRDLIRDYSMRSGVTVLLTSHDTGDIEGVCERVLVVNKGSLALDSSVEQLRSRYIRKKRITVQTSGEAREQQIAELTVVEASPHRLVYEMQATSSVSHAISRILESYEVSDLKIEDPPLEQIISRLYQGAE